MNVADDHTVIYINSMAEYHRVVRHVVNNGRRRSPRGMLTLDAGSTTIVLKNITQAMPIGLGRKLNPAIGAVEAIQLVAGRADPELVLKIAPRFKQYLNGGRFHGSYGARIGKQMLAATRRLTNDPDTRQAIVTLWEPSIDTFDGMKDYPCTIGFNFAVGEHGTLEMNVIMRSNDVWRGFAYDVFQFTQLQHTLARVLGRWPGTYRHTTWSMHMYESDIPLAANLTTNLTLYRDTWQPVGFGLPKVNSFNQAMVRASMIMRNEEPDDMTESEMWYRDKLHPAADLG